MGMEIYSGALIEFLIGACIASLTITTLFLAEWSLGLIRVNGLVLSSLSTLPTIFIYLVIGALGEELLERSLLLNGLRVVIRSTGLAMIIMAAIVALLHAGLPHSSALSFVNHALGGIMFGLAFIGTKHIWMPFGLHLAWNLSQSLLFGLPESGLSFDGLVSQVPAGPEIITGGVDGPDGGLLEIVFRFALMALVLAWLRFASVPKRQSTT